MSVIDDLNAIDTLIAQGGDEEKPTEDELEEEALRQEQEEEDEDEDEEELEEDQD